MRLKREAEGKSEELQYADGNRAQLVLKVTQLCERMQEHEVAEASSELGCTLSEFGLWGPAPKRCKKHPRLFSCVLV